jgi:hypothetical protein
MADVPSGLSLTPPQETKEKTRLEIFIFEVADSFPWIRKYIALCNCFLAAFF